MAQLDTSTTRFRPFTRDETDQVVRLAAELWLNTDDTPEADKVDDHHILAAAEVLLLDGRITLPDGQKLEMPCPSEKHPLLRVGVRQTAGVFTWPNADAPPSKRPV